MVKKIDAESVRREDMPSYKDRSMLSRIKNAIDEGHKNLPEMMRRKSAAETDAGKVSLLQAVQKACALKLSLAMDLWHLIYPKNVRLPNQ